jgi:hypothetical protein
MRAKTIEAIRRDLERRGVAPEFSRSISDRLHRFAGDLTPDAYEAVLSGVALAYGVHRQGQDGAREDRAGLDEVQRLMGAFASELAKLEEVLETLAAYLTRMRTQTEPAHRTLH